LAPLVPTPFEKDELHLVRPPTDLDLGERATYLSLAVSLLKGRYLTYKEVVTATLQVFIFAFPDLLTHLTQMGSVTVTVQDATRDELDRFFFQGAATWREVLPIPAPDAAVQDAVEVVSTTAVFASAAMVFLCLGKQARESAPSAATIKRPRALIREFSLSDLDQRLMPGKSAGPSVSTLEYLFSAFNVYTEPRSVVVRYLLGVKASSPHYPTHIRPFITNLKMTANAGMTHVGAIHKLIQAHPWVIRIPELLPYFRIFCQDLNMFHSIPDAVRPYHRLVAPPDDHIFLTSDLKPLVAVAGAFLADVEKDFKDYVYGKDDYKDLINRVKSRAPNYRSVDLLADIARDLGLPDIPDLPEIAPLRPEGVTETRV